MLLVEDFLHRQQLDNLPRFLLERGALLHRVPRVSKLTKNPRERSSRAIIASKASTSGRPALSLDLVPTGNKRPSMPLSQTPRTRTLFGTPPKAMVMQFSDSKGGIFRNGERKRSKHPLKPAARF